MYLILAILLVLVASYGLCAALVVFAERLIRPRGSEIAGLATQSSATAPTPTLRS